MFGGRCSYYTYEYVNFVFDFFFLLVFVLPKRIDRKQKKVQNIRTTFPEKGIPGIYIYMAKFCNFHSTSTYRVWMAINRYQVCMRYETFFCDTKLRCIRVDNIRNTYIHARVMFSCEI